MDVTNISFWKRFLLQFSFPILIYVLYVLLRLAGIQPPMEQQLGEFVTAASFLFGSFISYFVFIALTQRSEMDKPLFWWWMMTLLLCLLALDELYMIHEQLGQWLGLRSAVILLTYGLMLGVLLLLNFSNVMKFNTLFFLSWFTLFAFGSQVPDYLYKEGMVTLMGREISYEHLFEMFGALALACAIVTLALRQLELNTEPKA